MHVPGRNKKEHFGDKTPIGGGLSLPNQAM